MRKASTGAVCLCRVRRNVRGLPISSFNASALSRAIVVISDFRDGWPPEDPALTRQQWKDRWNAGARGCAPGVSEADRFGRSTLPVVGGYLERLPLAAVKAGWAEFAEIWSFWRSATPPPETHDTPFLTRRAFHADGDDAPIHSEDLLAFIETYGAPKILVVFGLGVSEAILEACRDSVIIYNSIDAPPLRVPPECSRHFDLVLTGAQWQSDAVVERHHGMATAILPVGPEFASADTFFPIAGEKLYDAVYVACAQPYKRHDIFLRALAEAPRALKALCVFGYGELADDLRRQAAEQGLDVTFVGPPGVPHSEVNRLMNLARVGVVCGVDDGAPAILTEYMLAGLPVVANADLRCGLQYITPQTGVLATADQFAVSLVGVVDRVQSFSPRQAVLDRWTWPHSIEKLGRALSWDNAFGLENVDKRSLSLRELA